MFILNDDKLDYPFWKSQFWFKRLDTRLYAPTNQNSIKVVKLTNKKRYYKTLGTSIINITLSLSFILGMCFH